jgi:hypothetical protein
LCRLFSLGRMNASPEGPLFHRSIRCLLGKSEAN